MGKTKADFGKFLHVLLQVLLFDIVKIGILRRVAFKLVQSDLNGLVGVTLDLFDSLFALLYQIVTQFGPVLGIPLQFID